VPLQTLISNIGVSWPSSVRTSLFIARAKTRYAPPSLKDDAPYDSIPGNSVSVVRRRTSPFHTRSTSNDVSNEPSVLTTVPLKTTVERRWASRAVFHSATQSACERGGIASDTITTTLKRVATLHVSIDRLRIISARARLSSPRRRSRRTRLNCPRARLH